MGNTARYAGQTERAICAAVCRGNGLKAKETGKQLGLDHSAVNQALCRSPLMKELCRQD